MTEDDAYGLALKELQSGEIKQGTMARCFVESSGDERLAKVSYLKSRASVIYKEFKRENDALNRERQKQMQQEAQVEADQRFLAQMSKLSSHIVLFTAILLILMAVVYSFLPDQKGTALGLFIVSLIFFVPWALERKRKK